jgi:hypothetical protein
MAAAAAAAAIVTACTAACHDAGARAAPYTLMMNMPAKKQQQQ